MLTMFNFSLIYLQEVIIRLEGLSGLCFHLRFSLYMYSLEEPHLYNEMPGCGRESDSKSVR